MRIRSLRKAVVIAVVGSLAAAGCGGDDDADDTASSEAPTSEPGSDAPATTETGSSEPVSSEPGSDAPATTETGSSEPVSSEPAEIDPADIDRDATVRLGWQGSWSSWDPARLKVTTAEYPYLSLTYDRLLFMNSDLELEPSLATSWELSDDQLSLELTLQEGVTFQDGTPLTADAVRSSLLRLIEPTSTSKTQFANMKDVEVVDDSTVRISLNNPSQTFPYTLAQESGFIVNPAALAAGDVMAPSGSGPYTWVESESTATRMVYERWEDYWDPSVPLAKRVVIEYIADDTARLNALKTGSLDVMIAPISLYPDMQQMTASGDFVAHSTTQLSPTGIYFNTAREPFGDVRVRKAISLAIDRNALNESLLYGQCRPTQQPFPLGAIGYVESLDEDIPSASDEDLAEARELLKEAGYENGFTMEAVVGTITPFQPMSEAIQAMLAEIGITMNITLATGSEAAAKFRAGESDYSLRAILGAADPAITIDRTILGIDNPGGEASTNEEILGLIDAAKALPLGSDERAEAFQAVNEYWTENPLHVSVCQATTTWLATPEVIIPEGGLPGSRIAGVLDPRGLGMRVAE